MQATRDMENINDTASLVALHNFYWPSYIGIWLAGESKHVGSRCTHAVVVLEVGLPFGISWYWDQWYWEAPMLVTWEEPTTDVLTHSLGLRQYWG